MGDLSDFKTETLESLRRNIESIQAGSRFDSSHSVYSYMMENASKLSLCLPDYDSKKLARNIYMAYAKNDTLFRCDISTVFGSIIQALQLNLEIGDNLGHCFLHPVKVNGEYRCQLIVGYKGMIDIALRSNQVKDIDAGIVYQKDLDEKWFSYRRGKFSYLKYNPPVDVDKNEKGEKKAWFACANTINGGFPFVILNKSDIAEAMIKSNHDSYKYWNKFPDQMELRVAYKKLFHKLPKSIDIQRGSDLVELETLGVDQGLSLDNIDIDGTINIKEKPI